ncbi:MAG: septum formation inhibitor Maf [Saprospiraceae bacterium]
MVIRLLFFLPLLLIERCRQGTLTGPVVNKVPEFDSYWNQGKAEITTYDLYQARYGEMREGEAVIIFVTEELSKEKQVKLDHPSIAEDQKIQVLKMNMTKKFNTGIYQYNMMLSSFVTVGGVAPWQAIKVAASCLEWCGQVYSQLNLQNDHYDYTMHSYFESDGDVHKHINRYTTEDAIWNLIRINPDSLLQSDSIMIIPSLWYARLSHKEFKPYRARTSKLILDTLNVVYKIEYPELNRSLYIEYEPTFPYSILKWTEEYKDGFGDMAKMLVTTATRKKQIMIDYWNKNHKIDDSLRLELELPKL